MKYFCVKYQGPFGFIKPWTAVRDETTYSQTFLAPPTLRGISQKLFGPGENDRILRYKLHFDEIAEQQEVIWAPERKIFTKKGVKYYNNSVFNRGVLLNPVLVLAFGTEADAQEAFTQHVCLCRNEDLLFPDAAHGVQPRTEHAFDELPGYELRETGNPSDLPVGRDRFAPGGPMTYGQLNVNLP